MIRLLAVASLALLIGCGDGQGDRREQPEAARQPEAAEETGMKAPGSPTEIADELFTTTDSGLKYHDLVLGEGDSPEVGQEVTVHYAGWLTDGTRFDNSYDRGMPFSFELGMGGVIRGWDEGVQGMKTGGKRQLVIPPHLGYGDRGAGGVIPPGATLIFEVEFLGAK